MRTTINISTAEMTPEVITAIVSLVTLTQTASGELSLSISTPPPSNVIPLHLTIPPDDDLLDDADLPF